jgi:hypothetical protein
MACLARSCALREEDGELLRPPRDRFLSPAPATDKDLPAAESHHIHPRIPGYLFAAFPRNSAPRSSGPTWSPHSGCGRPTDAHVSAPAVDSALSVDPHLGAHPALARGQKVRIIAGPFRGIEGVVQSTPKQTRVVLNVEMIGQSIALEVDADQIELIPS